MPVIQDIQVSLNANEAGKIPGLRCRGLMQQRVLDMLPDIIGDISNDNLIQPALAYNIIPVKSKNRDVVELEQGTCLHAPLLVHRLARASRLAFAVVTIGNTIAETINHLFKTGMQLKAILMEELANAYLFKLNMYLQQLVDEAAAAETLVASGALAPGDDGFDVTEQASVLKLAGAADINVSLSRSFMMKPRHSVSHVIGIGRKMQRWTQVENCAECAARDRCPYRHTAEVRPQ